jgi:hypothetical protein
MVPFHRLLAVVGLVGLLQADPAIGAEWTLTADVEQTVEVDDNFGLDKPSEGVLFGSTSRIDLHLGAQTERTWWKLTTGTRLSAFAGSGDDTGLDRADPRATGQVVHQGKRFRAGARFQFTRASVASTQFGLARPPATGAEILPDDTEATFDDLGTISNDDAIETILNLRSGVIFDLDPLNRLSLDAFGRRESFSGNVTELADVNVYGTVVGWEHDITERTNTDLSFRLQRLTADDLENTDILGLTATGGFDTVLTPRLTFGLDAGFSVADIERDPPGRDETPFGFAGGLEVAYQLADTQLSFEAKHGLEASALDDLQERTIVGFLIEHAVNYRSRLSLLTSYSRQVPIDDSTNNRRELFVLSPDYSIDLTPNWRARMGYILRLGDDSGLATSNNLFIEINRSFDLLR